MGAEAMVVGPRKRKWGTWEELILGGAVLRHGTNDWNVVASELRSRTINPNYFTPETCKAKYEDLQKRYSGCNAWFEELRKRRVEELKRELEKYESSIGSLLRKIESLKAEGEQSAQIDYGPCNTESPSALVKSEHIESIAKDGISAGSFTLETRTNFLPEFEGPGVASAKEIVPKLECSESCEPDEVPSTSNPEGTANGNGGALTKKRGKRKRKDAVLDVKEWSIGGSDNMCSISGISTSQCKETSNSCDQSIRHSTIEDDTKEGSSSLMNDNLMEIFTSIIQTEAAMVFSHRLDSQKRVRYKSMIRQHIDIETVRSRLVSCSIKSAAELFRDLLLLATNALVFYSKRTRVHKSALSLREIVTKAYHNHYKSSYCKATNSLLFGYMPVKPRSTRPRPSKHKLQAKSGNNVNITDGTVGGDDQLSDTDSKVPLQSLLAAKKGFKRRGKFKHGSIHGSVNETTRFPGKGRNAT